MLTKMGMRNDVSPAAALIFERDRQRITTVLQWHAQRGLLPPQAHDSE